MSKEHRMEPLDEGEDSRLSKIAKGAVDNLYQAKQDHYCDEPATQSCERTSEDVGDQEYSGGSEAKFKKIGDRFVNDEMDKG